MTGALSSPGERSQLKNWPDVGKLSMDDKVCTLDITLLYLSPLSCGTYDSLGGYVQKYTVGYYAVTLDWLSFLLCSQVIARLF